MAHHINLGDILIVAALPSEFNINSPWHLLHTGVGKVNAAARLSAKLIDLHKEGTWPKLVINVGSAGSPTLMQGEVIQIAQYEQHDFDLGPLEAILKQNRIYDFSSELQGLGLNNGTHTIHTGDRFMTETHPYHIIDMESYSLAGVCAAHGLPFTAFKYISDGTNQNSSSDWLETIGAAEKLLHQKVMAWLGA